MPPRAAQVHVSAQPAWLRRVPPALVALAVAIPLAGVLATLLVLGQRGRAGGLVALNPLASRAVPTSDAATSAGGPAHPAGVQIGGLAPAATSTPAAGTAAPAATPTQALEREPPPPTRAPEPTQIALAAPPPAPTREPLVVPTLVPLPSPTKDSPLAIPTTAIEPQPTRPPPTRTPVPVSPITLPTSAPTASPPAAGSIGGPDRGSTPTSRP